MKCFTYIRAHWIFVTTHYEYNTNFHHEKVNYIEHALKKAGRYTNIPERFASKIITSFKFWHLRDMH